MAAKLKLVNNQQEESNQHLQPPLGLTPSGKKVWDILIPILTEAKTIKATDVFLLQSLSEHFAVWLKATRRLNREGLLIEIKQGHVANPCVGIMSKTHDSIVKMLVQIGMSPRSRTQVIEVLQQETDKFDEL